MPRFASLPKTAFAFGLSLFTAIASSSSPQEKRVESPSFTAEVTGFQTSVGGNGRHFVTATVHLQNRTKKPLILGIERGKITASDDQKNAYVFSSMRGIGMVNGSTVDAKFVLPPEGGGDAQFELVTRIDPRTIRGVSFDLSLAVRELSLYESGQVKLGIERVAEFSGLKTGMFGELSDRTVDAGPFTAQLTRTKAGQSANRRWHTVDLTLRLKNISDKPLILAYESTSSYGIDDQGNRFGYGTAGTHDTSFSGIGLAVGNTVDPQFVLAPGESKDIRFTVIRAMGREVAGTEMAYYVALQSLEILPSKQIRTVRQYSLTFPGVSLSR